MDNLNFNIDSGFRPPSPISFSPSGPGLFGESSGFDDFLSMPSFQGAPGGMDMNLVGGMGMDMGMNMGISDPTVPLFNPSEQRYFSEFLDAMVSTQDFTFDPSLIPNLPTLSTAASSNVAMFGYPQNPPMSLMASVDAMNIPADYHHIQQAQQQFSPIANDFGVSAQQGHSTVSQGGRSRKGARAVDSTHRKNSSNGLAPIQELQKLSLNNTVASASKAKKVKRETEYKRPASALEEEQAISSSNSNSNLKNSAEDEEESGSENSGSDQPSEESATATSTSTTATKRKPHKELLTEEEKKANHIASEQRRRNTIRIGFKDMTDIVPELRGNTHSKSTILFKAVDFIQHLERRNQALQATAAALEARLEQQHQQHHPHHLQQHQQVQLHEHQQQQQHLRQQDQQQWNDRQLQEIPHFYPIPTANHKSGGVSLTTRKQSSSGSQSTTSLTAATAPLPLSPLTSTSPTSTGGMPVTSLPTTNSMSNIVNMNMNAINIANSRLQHSPTAYAQHL